jgi:hypothetical protein
MTYSRSNFHISNVKKIEKDNVFSVEIKYGEAVIGVVNKDRKECISIKIVTKYVKGEELSDLKFLLNDFVKILEQAKYILLEHSK